MSIHVVSDRHTVSRVPASNGRLSAKSEIVTLRSKSSAAGRAGGEPDEPTENRST